MTFEEVMAFVVGLAGAIVAWALLGDYGWVVQTAGAVVAFVLIIRAVSL